MDVTIYKTTAFSQGLDFVAQKIRSRKKDPKTNHIVIVPDRYTFQTEKALFANSFGAFDVEVQTFRRMAAAYCQNKKTISKSGSAAVLSSLISQNATELDSLFGAAGKKGFAASVFETISQLKSCLIMPEHIALSTSGLGRKMADIRFLYAQYESFLQELDFCDAAEMLKRLCEELRQSHKKNTHYYITGFYSLTNQVLQIVKALGFCAQSLTITAVCDQSNDYLFNNTFFDDICTLFQGYEIKIINQKAKLPLLGKLCDCLYSGRTKIDTKGKLTVFEGKNIIGELLNAARDIKYHIVNDGLRYQDFGVIIPDPCFDTVHRIFAGFGIPYYAERKQNLQNYPMSRFVLNCIEAVLSDFRQSDVIRLTKNPFLLIEKDQAEQFENYVLSHRINRALFFKQFSYDKIEQTRVAVAQILSSFASDARSCHTAAQFENSIKRLLRSVDYEKTLEQLKDIDPFTVQAYERFELTISQLSAVLSDRQIDIEEYFDALENALIGVEIALIPQKSDCVEIGAPEVFLLGGKKILYVLGLNEGVLPVCKTDAGIISDYEIEKLKKESNIDISPKISFVNNSARHILTQAIITAEQAVLSYSLADMSGKQLNKASYLKNILAVLDNYKTQAQFALDNMPFFAPVSSDDSDQKKSEYKKEILKYVCSDAGARHFLIKCARLYQERERPIFPYAARLLMPRYSEQENKYLSIYSNEPKPVSFGKSLFYKNSTSISQLEDYFCCPYKHFLSHGIRFVPRDEGEIESKEIGTILHKTAELYGKGRKQADDLESFGAQCFDNALKQKEEYDKIDPSLVQRLRQEALRMCSELEYQLANTKFQNNDFEVVFGKESKYPPIMLKVGKEMLALWGKIDRVDEYPKDADNVLVRVVDYKTGKNALFSSSELYYGKKVQLLVYLEAMRREGRLPVGAFYFRVHNDFGDSQTAYALNGVYVYDRHIVEMMDTSLVAGEKSRILAAKMNADGNLRQNDYEITDIKKLQMLCDYAKAVCQKGAEEIWQGNIAPSPLKSGRSLPCSYCGCNLICGFDLASGRIRTMQKVSLGEIIGTEQAQEENNEN